MCKRHRQVETQYNERIETPERAYEGDTVRLGTVPQLQTTHSASGTYQRKHFYHGGFPWWTLWLIWPLFGVIKGLFAAFGATATAFFTTLPTYTLSFSAVWPIALIVIGVLLLRRR